MASTVEEIEAKIAAASSQGSTLSLGSAHLDDDGADRVKAALEKRPRMERNIDASRLRMPPVGTEGMFRTMLYMKSKRITLPVWNMTSSSQRDPMYAEEFWPAEVAAFIENHPDRTSFIQFALINKHRAFKWTKDVTVASDDGTSTEEAEHITECQLPDALVKHIGRFLKPVKKFTF